MDRQIKFLKYLKQIKADVVEQNVNAELELLSLATEDQVYAFLNDLEKIKFIEWRDGRPKKLWDSPYIVGLTTDSSAPLDYQAKITLQGLQYLREDELKVYNKWTTIVAVLVAVVAAIIGWYYSNAAKDKDDEIKILKNEKAVLTPLLESKEDSLRLIKSELFKTKDSLAVRFKKDSTAVKTVLDRHPLNQPIHADMQKKILN